MDSWNPVERKASTDDVVDFVQGAFRQERLREDIAAVFEWISELDDPDLASQHAVLVRARAGVAQAVREERKSAAKLASQAALVLVWANEARKRSVPPPPVAVAVAAVAPPEPPAAAPARRMPAELAYPVLSVLPPLEPAGDRKSLFGEARPEARKQEPAAQAQSDVAWLFEGSVEIQTNVSEIGPGGSQLDAGAPRPTDEKK